MHGPIEPRDNKPILKKIWHCYDMIQRWLNKHRGSKSPSDINIAMTRLRELEEKANLIHKDSYYRLSKEEMKSLNQYWKQYKV